MKAVGPKVGKTKPARATYLPDFTADGIDDIDFGQLQKLGIKHLLFDLDQTLRRPYTRKLNPKVVRTLSKITRSRQFTSLCLVSNNMRNLERYAQPIGARIFQPYFAGWKLIRKPNPVFFDYVLRELQAKPQQAVMIGDRLHADILGGNRSGIYTIYVKKRGAIDYWFDWLLLSRVRDSRRLRDAIAKHRLRRRRK